MPTIDEDRVSDHIQWGIDHGGQQVQLMNCSATSRCQTVFVGHCNGRQGRVMVTDQRVAESEYPDRRLADAAIDALTEPYMKAGILHDS